MTDRDTLQALAEAIHAKYGDDWRFHVDGDSLSEGDRPSGLCRVVPHKVLSYAKDPHAQTSYAF